MTYYDSAEDIEISKERALIELRRHGLDRPEDIADFFTDCGEREHYDAQKVLGWLGY